MDDMTLDAMQGISAYALFLSNRVIDIKHSQQIWGAGFVIVEEMKRRKAIRDAVLDFVEAKNAYDERNDG